MKILQIVAAVLFLIESPAQAGKATASVDNTTANEVVVYVAFGADSAVKAVDWKSFCTVDHALNCHFTLASKATQALPLAGKYLNATLSFTKPVSCNTTKAELNINNPKWYDIADVSLVDGYDNKIEITAGSTKLGPPVGAAGNEKIFGVYPLGCDICTCRQKPPCGMKPGCDGCKKGTQYKPDVPCQYQGSVKGGGEAFVVIYSGT